MTVSRWRFAAVAARHSSRYLDKTSVLHRFGSHHTPRSNTGLQCAVYGIWALVCLALALSAVWPTPLELMLSPLTGAGRWLSSWAGAPAVTGTVPLALYESFRVAALMAVVATTVTGVLFAAGPMELNPNFTAPCSQRSKNFALVRMAMATLLFSAYAGLAYWAVYRVFVTQPTTPIDWTPAFLAFVAWTLVSAGSTPMFVIIMLRGLVLKAKQQPVG